MANCLIQSPMGISDWVERTCGCIAEAPCSSLIGLLLGDAAEGSLECVLHSGVESREVSLCYLRTFALVLAPQELMSGQLK